MLTFVKLGGSVITHKDIELSFRRDIMSRLAAEISQALHCLPQSMIVGHGSGSFGHFAAQRHGTMQGVATAEQWYGFAEVALVAAELSGLVARALWDAGVPVWRFQPSASLVANDGIVESMMLEPVKSALTCSLVPLVHGDVSLDKKRGGTIVSTESLFTYLAGALPVTRIVLVGEVPGVLDEAGGVIPRITPSTLAQTKSALKGSGGTDVTGGMLTKVTDMVALVERSPSLSIRIVDGTQPGVVCDVLSRPESAEGTLITAD